MGLSITNSLPFVCQMVEKGNVLRSGNEVKIELQVSSIREASITGQTLVVLHHPPCRIHELILGLCKIGVVSK